MVQLNVVQPQSALDTLWIVYMLIPAIGTVLSVLVMAFYRLKDSDAELMAKCNAGEITREECESRLSKNIDFYNRLCPACPVCPETDVRALNRSVSSSIVAFPEYVILTMIIVKFQGIDKASVSERND